MAQFLCCIIRSRPVAAPSSSKSQIIILSLKVACGHVKRHALLTYCNPTSSPSPLSSIQTPPSPPLWTSFKVNLSSHLSPRRQVPSLKPTRRLPSPRPPTLQQLLHTLLRLPDPRSTHHPPHPSLFLRLHLPLSLAGLQTLLKGRHYHPHRPTLIPHTRASRSGAFLIAQSTGCLASDDHLLDLRLRAADNMGRSHRRGPVCLLPWCGGEHGRCGLAAGCLIGLGERGEERGV